MNNTFTIKDREELAKRLMNGDKLKTFGLVGNYCFFTNEELGCKDEGSSPFRYGNEKNSYDLDGFWKCADGETHWELVVEEFDIDNATEDEIMVNLNKLNQEELNEMIETYGFEWNDKCSDVKNIKDFAEEIFHRES